MNVGSLLSIHLVPVSIVTISLPQFESTAIGNGVDVSDGSENIPSKDLAALSVRSLLDGLLVDMVMVKRERRTGNCALPLLLPTILLLLVLILTVQTFIRAILKKARKTDGKELSKEVTVGFRNNKQPSQCHHCIRAVQTFSTSCILCISVAIISKTRH